MDDLRGKVVLVTGGAHGIGREVARAFGREGARVVVADIRDDWLDEALADLAADGVSASAVTADIASREEVHRMIDVTERDVGPVDVLVNNAGVVFTRHLEELAEDEITTMISVNLYGPIWATRRVLPGMIERRSGHIVNVASAAGKTTNPYLSVYCATKAGLIGFTDSINQELFYRGIGTTVVNPGWISSGMFKGAKRIKFITRWTSPRDAGEAIVEAVKKGRAEIHVPRMMWIGGFFRNLLGQKLMAKLWRLFRGDALFAGVVGHRE